MVSRAQRTALANWWWTVDRWLLVALTILIVAGMILTMAASPPVAERIGLPTFHFVNRQALALVPAVAVMIGVSLPHPAPGAAHGGDPVRRGDGPYHRRAALRP